MYHTGMTEKNKIDACLELFKNHKNAMAFRSEYTPAKYDFLVLKGKIFYITKDAYNQAKGEYQMELINVIKIDSSMVNIHTAEELVESLARNDLTEKQHNYIRDKAKGIMVMKYFDSITELKF